MLETIEGGTRISSRMLLQAAQQRSLDCHRLEEQLGRLGGSGWVLERLELDLEGDLFLPVAELNRMRRELLEQLQQPPVLQMARSSC